MSELRLRAVRDPDAPPVEKVKAASGWARSGSGACRRSAGGMRKRGRPALGLFVAAAGGPGPGQREGPCLRGPRGARPGSARREHGSGIRLEVVSPRRKKERAGGGAPPPASQGCGNSPARPEVFLGVKTSKPPESRLGQATLFLCVRLRLFRTPLNFGGGVVSRQGPGMCL